MVLEPSLARETLIEAGIPVPAGLEAPPEPTQAELKAAMERAIAANSGPPVPIEERDVPTPPALLAAVLGRDGHRCRCCDRTLNLTGHHKVYRSRGGRTDAETLVTVCDDCHSLVHDGLIIVITLDDGTVRFVDRAGRDLRRRADRSGPGAPATLELKPPEPLANGVVSRETRDGARTDASVSRETRRRSASSRSTPRLSELVGQALTVRRLKRAVAFSRQEGVPAPHILLTGPPGLGKTTFARAAGAELGTRVHETTAPALADPDALADLLAGVGQRDFVFVDEIHRMPAQVAELLYETMDLASFTLVGATTEEDLLAAPFRSRFVVRSHLDFYTADELTEILLNSARGIELDLDVAAARVLASVSRETPREALGLLETVRAEAGLAGVDHVGEAFCGRVLEFEGVDRLGLRPFDRRYLGILRDAGRAVGAGTLAAALDVSKRALRRVHEPYLIRRGLVEITPHGRVTRGGTPAAASGGRTRGARRRRPDPTGSCRV